VVSRWCAISLIWRLRYVRTDTEGKSKAFADTVGAADWWLSGALGALALLPVILLVDPAAEPRLPGASRRTGAQRGQYSSGGRLL